MAFWSTNSCIAERILILDTDIAVDPNLGLPVVGIFYGEYGNPTGQLTLTEDQFHRLFSNSIARQFGLRVAPGEVAALRTRLPCRSTFTVR